MQDGLKVIDIYAAAWSPTLRGVAKKLVIFQFFFTNRFVFRAFNRSICTVS